MPFTAAADDQALDALANVAPTTNLIGFASLHSAYSATGANELTGGSPAYGRVALTWSGAAGSSKSLSGTPSAFNVPAGSTVAWIGMWSASTAGTFTGMGANGAAAQFVFTASTTGNLFTAPGSSYANGQAVVLFPGAGGTVPGGFTAGTVYYIVSASGVTFQLAATSGGSAITVTSAGSGLVQAITLETFGAQGFFTINADTLSLV